MHKYLAILCQLLDVILKFFYIPPAASPFQPEIFTLQLFFRSLKLPQQLDSYSSPSPFLAY